MKKRQDIICLNCGEAFHPNRPESKFCCRNCANLYNKTHGIMKKTEEQKAKLSKAHLGKVAWNKGKKTSKEQIEKFKATITNTWTEEKKELQRQKQKELWANPQLINKHRIIMTEKMSDKEIRTKISKSLCKYNQMQTKEYWAKRTDKILKTKAMRGTAFISNGEKEIIQFVKSLGFNPIKYIVGQHDTRFEIDCYIPELKIGIEYNGVYYHSKNGRNNKPNTYHYKKQLEAAKQDIDLIQVWEDQWLHKQELIKSILKARLRKNKNLIYARKCVIKEINNTTYNTFCNQYHIQGTRRASIKLGLYYNNKLIQIASFNKPQNTGKANTQNTLYDYEFVRGCTLPDINVIGGVSKLFKYFIKLYNPNSILSYVDWNLFNGKSYKECGFELIGYTGPDLFFITANTLNRIARNPYKYKEHMTLVSKNQLWECHGAGNLKMVWHK